MGEENNNRKTIEIWCWESNGFPRGHAAIGLRNQVYGFFPKDEEEYIPGQTVPGNVKEQGQHLVALDYLDLCMRALTIVSSRPLRAVVRKDGVLLLLYPIEVFVYTVSLPKEVEEELVVLYKSLCDKAPDYNVRQYNCVSLAIDSLQQFSVLKFSCRHWPHHFRAEVKDKIDTTEAGEIGRVLQEQIRVMCVINDKVQMFEKSYKT